MGIDTALSVEFGPTAMRGLLEYGPFDTELGLELGLSIWLHRSETRLEEAHAAMLELRTVIIEVSGMDPKSEPFPLIGRAPEKDLVTLAGYLGSLVTRAASACGRDIEEVVELAINQL